MRFKSSPEHLNKRKTMQVTVQIIESERGWGQKVDGAAKKQKNSSKNITKIIINQQFPKYIGTLRS